MITTGPDSLLPGAAISYAEYARARCWQQNRLSGVGPLAGLRRWRDEVISVEIVFFQPEELEEPVDTNHLDPEAVGQADVALPTLVDSIGPACGGVLAGPPRFSGINQYGTGVGHCLDDGAAHADDQFLKAVLVSG